MTNVKPYHEIPGPPGKGLPFIGHYNLLSKKPHGLEKAWLNMEILQQKYLKDHDKLMRLNFGILIARKSALEKTQLSDVLITDNLF